MRHLKLAALLSASTIIWACTAADPNTGGPSKESDSKSGDSKSSSNKTSSSSSGGSNNNAPPPPAQSTNPTEPAPAGECSAAQGEEACSTCCEDKNPQASDFVDDLDEKWTQCACAPAACATQCAASACGEDETEPADGDACSTCLENTPCDDQWDAACEANTACAALLACEEPCSGEDGEDEEEDDFKAGGKKLPEEMKQLRELKVRTAKAIAKHKQILQRHRASVLKLKAASASSTR